MLAAAACPACLQAACPYLGISASKCQAWFLLTHVPACLIFPKGRTPFQPAGLHVSGAGHVPLSVAVQPFLQCFLFLCQVRIL